MRKMILFSIAMLLPVAVFAVPLKTIPPRDECLSLDGYFEFRQSLESIVKRRDAKALTALVDPKIEWSFGGDAGATSFVKNWKLSQGAASPIWKEFDAILPLGCGRQEGGIVAFPHNFTVDWGTGDAGAGYALVTGEGVNLRAGPGTNTASKGKLDWEVVSYEGDAAPAEWRKVKTSGGQIGYVKSTYLRDALAHRAGFQRKNGKWVMTFFIAGD